MTAIQALAALAGLLSAFVVGLAAWRRIPRAAAPDDIIQLRSDLIDLGNLFRVFVEQHDVEMGRHHAKVQHLRRKLRSAEDVDLEEEEEPEPQLDLLAPPPPVLSKKEELRRRVSNMRLVQ